MQQLEVPIISRIYELYKTLYEFQRNIPKTARYSLWIRIQDSLLDVLEGLMAVGYVVPQNRSDHLVKIAVKVDKIRVFIRLCYDTKIINQKKYLSLQSMIDEIGRMLGGWIKSQKAK